MKNKIDSDKVNSILDKINFIIIICLIALVPITFFINYFSLFHFGSRFTFKIHQVLTFILPIEIFIHFYKLFTRRHRIDIFDLLIYLLILFGIISTIYAEDVNLAIWGSIYRYEGLVQICAYYMLFLNSRFINKKELIVKIVNSLIIVGILQFIYSFLQVFVRGRYIYVKYEYVFYRASGFIGHPNMLGSYVVLTLLLALGMYFLYDKNKKFYLISSILLYINLILAESTGPFYGFICGLIFMFAYLLKKKKIHFSSVIITSMLVVIGLLGVTITSRVWCAEKFHDRFRDDFTIIGDVNDTFTIIKELFINSNYAVSDVQFVAANSSFTGNYVQTVNFDKSETNDEVQTRKIERYGSNRIWLWSRSLKLVPKYWLHGTGIDNFTNAFSETLTEEDKSIQYLRESLFDRAHNEYLHLLVTQGVFAFIAYLMLLLFVFIKGIKSKDLITWVLLFGFVGYAIQAFANISVYNVAPFFFIVMGMLVGRELNKDSNE